MAKFKVKFTRVETYVHEEIVEARNREAAIFEVERKGFEYPGHPILSEDKADAEEVDE